jgi:parallel beta-helix repeat protein
MFVLAFNIQSVKATSGTIIINPNGSITPSTANITTTDKITYTFTGNNYLPIVVNRSNIIINGMGHTLQASEEAGFSLTGASNVTIKNTTITNSGVGIYLFDSNDNVLSGNNVTANSDYGIYLYHYCNNNVLSGNNLTANNYAGIWLYSSCDNNTLSGNSVTENGGIGIWLESSSDNLESSCDNNTLSGNNVTTNGDGIVLEGSSGNVLSGNNVTANGDDGIDLETPSDNNTLSGNNVTANRIDGIFLEYSSGNVLSGNNAANSHYGIYLDSCSYNVLSDNNVTANSVDGVYLSSCSGNTFFHNNFVNNTQQVSSYDSLNTWDDGYPFGGNYWSDYETRYPNATEYDSSGIWNTPYVMNANNTDRYPLVHPWSSLPVHNINTGLGYATIQDAIDAPQTLNGHVIYVDAGTYYEHLIVSKSLTLVGEDKNTTVIDGSGTGRVVQITADYVSISNFTIRNGSLTYPGPPFGACVFGVYLHDIDIENNTIFDAGVGITIGDSYAVNIRNNIVSDTVGMGIDVGDIESPGLNRNITVSNNSVRAVTGEGINIDGDTEDCSFINNTVIGCGNGMDLEPNVDTLLVPSNNLIEGNVLSNNSVANLFVKGAQSRTQADYTNTFRENRLTNSQHNNLIVWGFNLQAFMQDIDASNTATGKRIYFLVNTSNLEMSPQSYPDAGYMALVNCSNVTIRDFDFAENKDGLLLAGSAGCILANMTIGDNRLNATEMNVTLPSHWGGLTFFESSNNTVEDCEICNCSYGVSLYHSDHNLFYHNSFMSNDKDVVSDYYYPFQNISSGYFSTNTWDNGYPSGGNYWSNYRTLYPNATEVDSSAIWNASYIIDSNNTDWYPLMGPFRTFGVGTWNGTAYSVDTVSNSTLSNFTFNPSTKTLTFNATGTNGTMGFCRVTIPLSLMSGEWTVTVNGTSIPYSIITDANCTYVFFTYHQSTETVQITSTNAVPEFQPYMLLPLLMMITLLTVVVSKRKRHPKK